MITKSDIIKAASENGFEDVGFTTADPFPEHKQLVAATSSSAGTDHRKAISDAATSMMTG